MNTEHFAAGCLLIGLAVAATSNIAAVTLGGVALLAVAAILLHRHPEVAL
jgi:hypothetical protein